MALTDTAIRGLSPKQKPYKKADERGLYLLVQPNGSRWWRFKYSFEGREKGISLGTYPDTPLKSAREKRDAARQLVAKGIDPSVERQAEKHSASITLKDNADDWLAEQTAQDPKTVARMRSRLEEWAYGKLGPRPITAITSGDVLSMLKLCQKKSPDTAHRLRLDLRRIWDYAIREGRTTHNVIMPLMGKTVLAPVVGGHRPGLVNPQEVGGLLRAIDGYQGQATTMLALKIAPYVALRPSELRCSRWRDIDFARKEWRIPPPRMKAKDKVEEHIVPMSKQVIALLRELEHHRGSGDLLLPGTKGKGRPMSDATLNSALRTLGYDTKTQHCIHGWRTTFSTLLNERGDIHPDSIEHQLAHVVGDKTRQAYNRAIKMEVRRPMMQLWANFLDELRDKAPRT